MLPGVGLTQPCLSATKSQKTMPEKVLIRSSPGGRCYLAAFACCGFHQVEPLALSAADGMNACIFAYGQTGSGKTHTMIGDAKGGEMAGVSYRTMNKLFQVLELRQRQQVRISMRSRCMEIP